MSEFVTDLLKYGNWSGPGWTAGTKSQPFEAAGVQRILSQAERGLTGLDSFDNYVAKAHDLNEYDAEIVLRDQLNGLGLISDGTQPWGDNGGQVFTERFTYGGRFVSYDHYKNQLDAGSFTDAQRLDFGKAFTNYYTHIAKSNAQFSIDFISNGTSFSSVGWASIFMDAQLAGAAHIFMAEAATLENLIENQLIADFGADVVNAAEIEAYLMGKFVTPGEGEDFGPVEGNSHQGTLTRQEVINLSRGEAQTLLTAYIQDLNSATPEGVRLEDVLEDLRALGGLDDFDALGQALVRVESAFEGDGCFLAGTMIDMWDGTQKSIEMIRPGDDVVSYDQFGNLQEGRVRHTFQHQVPHILDLFGVQVTPGHAMLCGDGEYEGHHLPVIDILRSDGALVLKDGTKVRAATLAPLESLEDQFVWAITGERQGRSILVRDKGRIRLGTRVFTADGEHISVLQMITEMGVSVGLDENLHRDPNLPGVPFHWEFTEMLPKPEDYILSRSRLTLAEIYQAPEWQDVGANVLRS